MIPENAWYLIPAVLLLGKRRKSIAMLCPLTTPKKKACYCYEGYREAWSLLKKSRAELLECGSDQTYAGCPILARFTQGWDSTEPKLWDRRAGSLPP